MNLKATGGFTLIELIVTIVIMAILAAIAIPSFSQMTARQKVKQAAYGFASSINEAIAQAQLVKGNNSKTEISLTTSPSNDVSMQLAPSAMIGKQKLVISDAATSGFGKVQKQVIQGSTVSNVTDLRIKFTHATSGTDAEYVVYVRSNGKAFVRKS